MTNKEWLNSLNNEEFAEKLNNYGKCGLCIWKYKDCGPKTCLEGITQWLKQKHKEPMPDIKVGDFIYTKTKEYGCMILVCVKEEEGKILFSIDKEKCFSLSAFLPEEILMIYRYNSEKHCMTKIWEADNEK